MQKMSTGADATLGNYRKTCAAFFGEKSDTTKFLDGKIKECGEDDEVIADEGQMVHLLMTIHSEGAS
jgi:hypothetical protein